MILIGTNNVSRGSDEEEAQWESMMMCLFTTLWQKCKCAVLTVCTVPMSTRTLASAGRRHNEGVIRWNNIVRNLASCNAGRMILMNIEHELRAMDQAKLTTDEIYFDSIEGQGWMNQVFQEPLDEMEVELFDTGVLKKEETTNEPALSTFVPPEKNDDQAEDFDFFETHTFPWYVYKQDLMKLNLQAVRLAADAIRMLNGARLSVNGLYSIASVDWLIAAGPP